MFIQRILRNAVLAELLLFLMVANCAPNRPREDVHGHVLGDPSWQPLSVSSSRSGSSNSGGSHGSKKAMGAAGSLPASPFGQLPTGFQRHYRFSTGCSVSQSGRTGDLLRFLPDGGLDARGDHHDPSTEIVLVSHPHDIRVFIYSQKRERYLCFNKKGKLVTKKKLGVEETLCQFYDTLRDGNRRFVSAFRRGHKKTQHQLPPWTVPLPGFREEAAVNRHSAAPAADLDEWQVGFGRHGEPLRGSAWRNPKQRACFDVVDHVDYVRPSQSELAAPIGDDLMLQIFQSENGKPAGSGSRTAPSAGKSAHKALTKNSSSSSVAKSSRTQHSNNKSGVVVSNRLPEAADSSSSKAGGGKRSGGKPGGGGKRHHPHSNHHHAVHAKATAAALTERTTTTATPAELPIELRWLGDSSDASNYAVTHVDFDSYLAETEQLLAQAAALGPQAAAPEEQQHLDAATVEYSPTAATRTSPPSPHRSAWLLRDSGGWDEVIVNQSVAGSSVDEEEDVSA